MLPTDAHGHSSICDALTPALPGLAAALQQPLSLAISAVSDVIQHIVPLLGATTLTQLHLSSLDLGRRFAAAMPAFLCSVSQLKLPGLRLHFRGSQYRGPGII